MKVCALSGQQKSLIFLGISIVLVSICCVTVKDNVKVKKFMSWTKRQVAIKIMKSFEISRIQKVKCLIENTLRKAVENSTDVCGLCESIDSVSVYGVGENVKTFFQNLHFSKPTVVKNSSYAIVNTHSITEFVQAFLSYEELLAYEPCQFTSNIKAKVKDHQNLLHLIDSGDVTSYYAIWENCADLALKAFRGFYSRPSYLEPNIQLTETNWALLCSDFNGKIFKTFEWFAPVGLVIVEMGSVEIQLLPKALCKDICVSVQMILEKGDNLVFDTNVYQMRYKPFCVGNETIVVGVGGYID